MGIQEACHLLCPCLVSQELLGEGPEGVVHQEAPREIDQLELLRAVVDVHLR